MIKYSKSKIILVYMGMNSPKNTGFNYELSYIGAVMKKEGFAVEFVSLLNERDRADGIGSELGGLYEKNGWLPCKEVYREWEEATIDYPCFPKEGFQYAAEAFPFFL